MKTLKAALVCAAAATTSCSGCGGQLADDDASADVTAEAAFVGCPLPECYGVLDLPVGTSGYGEDTCRYACVEAGAPLCLQNDPCSCGHNPCDGSPGSCACLFPPPEPGPGCVIPTCSGSITLPRGTATLFGVAADRCVWDCNLDGSTYCAGGSPPVAPCTCGVSICDAGASD